jgi:hypothetical protein
VFRTPKSGDSWVTADRATKLDFTELSPDPTVRRGIGSLSGTEYDDADIFVGTGASEYFMVEDSGTGSFTLATRKLDERMMYRGLPCKAYKFRIDSGSTVRLDGNYLVQTVNYKCRNDSTTATTKTIKGNCTSGRGVTSAGHSSLGLFQSMDGLSWQFKSTVVSW